MRSGRNLITGVPHLYIGCHDSACKHNLWSPVQQNNLNLPPKFLLQHKLTCRQKYTVENMILFTLQNVLWRI